MTAAVFGRSSMLPHSCSCSFAPWGHDEYSSSALERGSASNGQSSGLDDGCGLWKLVLHVTQWLVLAALLHGEKRKEKWISSPSHFSPFNCCLSVVL